MQGLVEGSVQLEISQNIISNALEKCVEERCARAQNIWNTLKTYLLSGPYALAFNV